jgi:hypothetical protein
MGIFDEEEKKMAEEADTANRAEEQRKAERSEVAHNVAEELTSYMGNHPRDQSIDIDVHENRVSLRKKTTSNTFEIACIGGDTFKMAVNGDTRGSVNKSTMARTVIRWLGQ